MRTVRFALSFVVLALAMLFTPAEMEAQATPGCHYMRTQTDHSWSYRCNTEAQAIAACDEIGYDNWRMGSFGYCMGSEDIESMQGKDKTDTDIWTEEWRPYNWTDEEFYGWLFFVVFTIIL